jgi:ring-1,2-phenylacetyl-CoA epoxidase subunit PaaC
MFEVDALDEAMMTEFDGPDLSIIAAEWQEKIVAILAEATLDLPQQVNMARGGKQGIHSEHFGYLLAQLQILPRSYPGVTW